MTTVHNPVFQRYLTALKNVAHLKIVRLLQLLFFSLTIFFVPTALSPSTNLVIPTTLFDNINWAKSYCDKNGYLVNVKTPDDIAIVLEK